MSIELTLAAIEIERLRAENVDLRKQVAHEADMAAQASTSCVSLRARVAELERNDARYRWLRDQMHAQALTTDYSLPICFRVDYKGSEGDSMDAAIDQAIRADGDKGDL